MVVCRGVYIGRVKINDGTLVINRDNTDDDNGNRKVCNMATQAAASKQLHVIIGNAFKHGAIIDNTCIHIVDGILQGV